MKRKFNFDIRYIFAKVYEGYGDNYHNLLLSATRLSSSPRPFFVVSKSNEMTIVVNNNYWSGTVCSPSESDKKKFRVSYSATTTPKYGNKRR